VSDVVEREIDFDASELRDSLWSYAATVFDGSDGKKLRGLYRHLKKSDSRVTTTDTTADATSADKPKVQRLISDYVKP
jgi:hypothetical protein